MSAQDSDFPCCDQRMGTGKFAPEDAAEIQGSGEGCVYGHSGSYRAACDRDAVTLRGGFTYCAQHAAYYDWAEAHQDDGEEADPYKVVGP